MCVWYLFLLTVPLTVLVHLPPADKPHVAEGDLWLSPTVRLLADAPGVNAFEYDGQGHR